MGLSTGKPLEGVEIGVAAYKSPEDPPPPAPTRLPWEPHPDTKIVQHFVPQILIPTQPVPQPKAVGTAVIEVPDPPVPPDHKEHVSRDLRLEITRGGKQIVHRQVYFNVPEIDHTGPLLPTQLQDLAPSLFLPLPAAALDSENPLELPADGTPPRFADLKKAVDDVLGHDPGDQSILSNLTQQQARHVAYEIVWNRKFRPLPVPG
ncbi:MAG: hypothetical protein ACRDTD_22580 [Pseudonocardiaceae bacterium]